MSSKSYSIQKTIQNLLGTVGISKTDVSFTDAMHAEVSVHYTQLWNFEPVYKDTVVKAAPENPKPTDELLSVEDLRKFKADKLNLIKEGIMIKKPFCNRLEKLSAKEPLPQATQNNIRIRKPPERSRSDGFCRKSIIRPA